MENTRLAYKSRSVLAKKVVIYIELNLNVKLHLYTNLKIRSGEGDARLAAKAL